MPVDVWDRILARAELRQASDSSTDMFYAIQDIEADASEQAEDIEDQYGRVALRRYIDFHTSFMAELRREFMLIQQYIWILLQRLK